MTNYDSMVKRIEAADTPAKIAKVSQSLDRCFLNGIFTVSTYAKLDSLILDKLVVLSTECD